MRTENSYIALRNKNDRDVFENYLKTLTLKDLDYFAIGFQDSINQKSCSMMSNLDWQSIFQVQGFAPYDPLRKAVFGCTNRFFSFDQIDYCDNFGKEIMYQRKRFGMSKGFVMIERHLGYNYLLTVATGYSQFDALDFYLQHSQQLKSILDDLKKLLTNESKNLLLS